MPESISVAAFVVGLVLVVAALVGRQVKIAAVELPDLNRLQRGIVGIMGAALIAFGLFDGQLPPLPILPPPGAPAVLQGDGPTPVSLSDAGVALPPEVAGNIRSAKASYGCGVLLGQASGNDEQLSVCGLVSSLPVEWITKVKRVNVDCATTASGGIVVELWTGANYTGDTWGYSFSCPGQP
jgi:hypothetical protein